MAKNTARIVLVTGASSGIGRACAAYLHDRGYRVYGTSRGAAAPPPSSGREAESRSSFVLLPMDVTDDASVERGVATVLAREGRLDVVVNNAGIGIAGAVEETPTAEARAQLETNVLGVLRVCRAVLPAMRRQGGGCIVNVSSLAGLIAVPFQALYSASKFAVEGLTEALRMEVRPWGVRVVLIEPGDFRTGFTGNRRTTPPAAREDSPYRARFVAALRVMEEEEAHGPPPERVARLLERIIDTPAPRLRYTVGLVWERSSAGLKRLLPWSVVEQGLRRYYRLRL